MHLRIWAIVAALCVIGCDAVNPPAPPLARPLPMPINHTLRSGLERVNYYRSLAGLEPIEVDARLSGVARDHARYLMQNNINGADLYSSGNGIRFGTSPSAIRDEVPAAPGYTEIGKAVARRALVYRANPLLADASPLVDRVMTVPSGILAALTAQEIALGYGEACRGTECVVVLVPFERRPPPQSIVFHPLDPIFGPPNFPARLRHPLEFPPPDSRIDLTAYVGGAPSDPLSTCAGYAAPSGPAIVLELGADAGQSEPVTVSAHSLSEDGIAVDSCAFDAGSYLNPAPQHQQDMRSLLRKNGAVVVIPRRPLRAGHSYAVSISADSETYRWSFSVAPQAR